MLLSGGFYPDVKLRLRPQLSSAAGCHFKRSYFFLFLQASVCTPVCICTIASGAFICTPTVKNCWGAQASECSHICTPPPIPQHTCIRTRAHNSGLGLNIEQPCLRPAVLRGVSEAQCSGMSWKTELSITPAPSIISFPYWEEDRYLSDESV